LDPDFVLFSTNYKPSAPAERALLLSSQFRQNYCVTAVLKDKTTFFPIFRRRGAYVAVNEIWPDARFVNLFYDAASLHREGKYRDAIPQLKRVAELAPPDFAVVYELLGQCHFNLGNFAAAEEHLKKAIEISDCSVIARLYIVAVYQKTGRPEAAEAEKKEILGYLPRSPW
jgi:tetratricopeptide (TPR) repeat protein